MTSEKRLIWDEDAKRHLIALAVGHNTEMLHIDMILNAILHSAPTVDAVEVVHAEWVCVNESENVWMCSGKDGCGNEILLLEKTPLENGFHYCPSCGAKMDGGNENA